MLQFVMAGILTVGGVSVEVKPLSGDPLKGEVIGLNNDTLLLRTPSGDQMLKVTDLEMAKPAVAPVAPLAKPTIRVGLIDGSNLLGTSYSVQNGRASIEVNGQIVQADTRSIQSVLLKSHDTLPELKMSWAKMKKNEWTGDTIVIRKEVKVPVEGDDDEAVKTEVVLNSLEGVLRDITATEVEFRYDGDLIPVKRTRVEGIIYHHPAVRKLRDPVCRIVDIDGCEWFLKSMELKEPNEFEIATTAGVQATLDIRRIATFDFTAGNTIYLSEMEPGRIDWKPFFDTGALNDSLAKLHRPRMNRSFNGGKLSVFQKGAVKSFEKGIAIHSKTQLEYLLPGDFKRFVATVGIEPTVRPQGNVKFVVMGDRETLYEGNVSGGDLEAIDLSLDLTGIGRLTILVDYGEGLDIADNLNLCNARITK